MVHPSPSRARASKARSRFSARPVLLPDWAKVYDQAGQVPGPEEGWELSPRREIDLRQYAAATRRRFVRWGIVLIVGVGLGLIALLYGTGAVTVAGLVLLIASLPVLAVIGILWVLEWIGKKADSD
jgi:hypothetical protein